MDKLLAMAITLEVKIPSIPVGVIKCCILGVNRKGTFSLHRWIGAAASNAIEETSASFLIIEPSVDLQGKTSLIYIRPVFKLRWKRPGVRLLKHAICDKNMLAAV